MTSQINPNNVDGSYPVAGQANNTQGFRDNFTNIKTNFQYAEDEITDLQSKAVLKSALSGSTLDNNMSDNLIYAVKLNDVSYTYIPLTATSGSITIDYSAAGFQQINLTDNISLNFTNWPASGSAGSVRVGFNITDVTQTVTLPAAVSQGLVGLQGVSPGTPGVSNTITFGVVGNYAFEFVTIDGGTTVWIFDNSRPTDVFSSPVTITSNEDSTSTSSGALVVDGGVGINGNLYVGGTIVGNVTVTGINVTGNAVAGNVNTSGIVSAVGNIVGGNINTAGRVTATGNVTGGNLNAVGLSLSGNVVSTLNVTGNINGGNIKSPGVISASGNITGGNIITLGSLTTAGSIINASISTTGNVTGTNVVANVVAASTAGNLWMTGNLIPTASTYSLGSEADPWESAWFGPASVTIADSTGNVANAVVIENNSGNITLSTAGFNIQTLGTTDSIFRIEAISGQIYSNANTIIQNATQATNTTSGSLQTAGGAGIVKNLYVGGLTSVTGNITGGNVLTGGLISATGNITTPASFSGNVVGCITNPVRNAGALGGGTLTLNFTTDSIVKATYDTATFTIAMSNYIAGRHVTVILTNTSGAGRTVNLGVSATNTTGNDASPSIGSGRTVILDYYSFDGDAANTFVAVNYN